MDLQAAVNLFAYTVFTVVMGSGLVHQLFVLTSGRPLPTDHDAARRLRMEAQQPDGTIVMGVLGVALVVAGLLRAAHDTGRPHWYFVFAVVPLVIAVGLRLSGALLLRRLGSAGSPGLDAAARRREPRRVVTGVLAFSGLFGAWVVEQTTSGPSVWALVVVFAGFVPGAFYVVDTARFMASIRPSAQSPSNLSRPS